MKPKESAIKSDRQIHSIIACLLRAQAFRPLSTGDFYFNPIIHLEGLVRKECLLTATQMPVTVFQERITVHIKMNVHRIEGVDFSRRCLQMRGCRLILSCRAQTLVPHVLQTSFDLTGALEIGVVAVDVTFPVRKYPQVPLQFEWSLLLHPEMVSRFQVSQLKG